MDSPLVDRLGWTLVHFVWQGTIVAIVLAIALRLVPRRAAAVRYGLAAVALAASAAAPVLTFLSRQLPEATVSASTGRTLVLTDQHLAAGHPGFGSYLPIFVAVWVGGVTVLALRLVGTLVHLERFKRRNCTAASPEWQATVDRLALRIGLARQVCLKVSERIQLPSAWGVFRPVIVMPMSLIAQLSPGQVETILLHELAHIRRHDYFVSLLQATVETVLFYHPAVWWISSVIRSEREHCCDDIVVGTLSDATPYARALLHLEERRLTLPHPTLSATGGNLMQRISRILNAPTAPSRSTTLTSTIAGLAILAGVLGGVIQAQAQSAVKPKPKATKKSKPAARHLKVAVAASAPPAPVAMVVSAALAAPAPVPQLNPDAKAVAFAPPIATVKGVLTSRLIAQKGVVQGKIARSANSSVAKISELAAPISSAQEVGIVTGAAQVAANALPAQTVVASGETVNVVSGIPARQIDPNVLVLEKSDTGNDLNLDAHDAPLALVMRRLAHQCKVSIVVGHGAYDDLTMVLTDMPIDKIIEIVCRAAGATFRVEGGVFYIEPHH